MKLIGTKWKLIDFDSESIIEFLDEGILVRYKDLNDRFGDSHRWEVEDDNITLVLEKGKLQYLGKFISALRFNGKGKNNIGERWNFSAEFISANIFGAPFHLHKTKEAITYLITSSAWKLHCQDIVRKNTYLKFLKNGVVMEYHEDLTSAKKQKWELEGETITLHYGDGYSTFTGLITGNRFFGKGRNKHGVSWFFLAQRLPNNNNVFLTESGLIGSKWNLNLAKSKSSLEKQPTSKRSLLLQFSGKLSYSNEKNEQLGVDNSWEFEDDKLTVFLNKGRSSFAGEIKDDKIIGEGINSKGVKWYFDGVRVRDGVSNESKINTNALMDEFNMFTVTEYNDENKISYLSYYHRYWNIPKEVRNPDFDTHSSNILNLKNNHPSAINYFYSRLNPIISQDGITLCYVPSSDPANNSSGIRKLCQLLTQTKNRIDGTGCIVRINKIPKLANGGDRSVSVHLNSLTIQDPHLIQGKMILLLDDVTTTNNSLIACKQLLMKAGAGKVYCFALGQTS
ncbi:phosphoribosyltransferase [Pedobacter sp. FW305-3-2-15-E-R2A2]|uniref:phosphoribosyltransferase n=1 Tax=Pedobacter sp. FW305-3-2-15-E-R2A2 TaxID=3140251 RepID=UPI003140B81A